MRFGAGGSSESGRLAASEPLGDALGRGAEPKKFVIAPDERRKIEFSYSCAALLVVKVRCGA